MSAANEAYPPRTCSVSYRLMGMNSVGGWVHIRPSWPNEVSARSAEAEYRECCMIKEMGWQDFAVVRHTEIDEPMKQNTKDEVLK